MTRDMTKKQFAEALKRNGFAHRFAGWFEDTTGVAEGVSFGGVFRAKPFKMQRRATIAHLIRSRARHVNGPKRRKRSRA